MLWQAKGFYSMVAAFGRAAGSASKFLFWVLNGVLQGCPLASAFFALAVDPLLVRFKSAIENTGLGRIRACADDIGAAFRSIESLIVMFHIFQFADRLAGLGLKFGTCCIVPLHATCDDACVMDIGQCICSYDEGSSGDFLLASLLS